MPNDPNQPYQQNQWAPQQADGYQPLFQQPAQQPYQPLFTQQTQPTGYQPPLNPAMQTPAAQQSGYQPLFTQPAQPTGYQPPLNSQPVQQSGYQQPLFTQPAQPTGYQMPLNGQPAQQSGYQPLTFGMEQPQVYPPYPQDGGGQPPVPPTEPPQGDPAEPPKQPPFELSPKARKILLRALIVLILVGAALAGWYLVSSANQQQSSYAQIQVGLLGSRYSGDALIVRNEVPYDADGVTSIEYVAEEGKTVSRGMSICNVFSSGYSTREMTTLQTYRDQIRDYQISLINAETTYDARLTKVEIDVLARAREVRDIISGTTGNLINQEKLLAAAVTARQNYLKTKYSSDQRLTRLYDDEQAQQQRIDSWTKPYVASSDAIVSFYSDGYEYGLTGSTCESFSPAEVRSMINGSKPDSASVSKSKTTIYRTIEDGEWYVLFLADDPNWMPVEGETYELQLEHFENTQVSATVMSTTRSGGELLVRLRVTDSVTPVLYMRSCQAEIGDTTATLQVPKAALYTQDEMQGVVVADGDNRYFVPVQVVYQSGDQVYISAITAGLLYEGQTIVLFN